MIIECVLQIYLQLAIWLIGCVIFAAVMMKHSFTAWLVGSISCLVLVHFTEAELFTAIVDLERILHAEYEVAQDLRHYVENEQRRIDTLKR